VSKEGAVAAGGAEPLRQALSFSSKGNAADAAAPRSSPQRHRLWLVRIGGEVPFIIYDAHKGRSKSCRQGRAPLSQQASSVHGAWHPKTATSNPPPSRAVDW